MVSDLAMNQQKELFDNCGSVLASMRWLVQVMEKQPEPVPLPNLKIVCNAVTRVASNLQSAHEQIEQHRADAQRAASDAQAIRDLVERQKQELEGQRAEVEILTGEAKTMRQSLDQEQQELSSQRVEVNRLASDARLAQQTLAREKMALQDQRSEVEILTSEVETAQQTLNRQRAKLESQRIEAVSLTSEAQSAQDILNRDRCDVEDQRAEVERLASEVESARQSLQREKEELQLQFADAARESAKARDAKQLLDRTKAEVEGQRTEAQRALSAAQASQDTLQRREQELEDRRGEILQEATDARKSLEQEKADVERERIEAKALYDGQMKDLERHCAEVDLVSDQQREDLERQLATVRELHKGLAAAVAQAQQLAQSAQDRDAASQGHLDASRANEVATAQARAEVEAAAQRNEALAAQSRDEAAHLRTRVEQHEAAVQAFARDRDQAAADLRRAQELEASAHEHRRTRLASDEAEEKIVCQRGELILADRALKDSTRQVQALTERVQQQDQQIRQQAHQLREQERRVCDRLDHVVETLEKSHILNDPEAHARAVLEGLEYIKARREDADREFGAAQDLRRRCDDATAEVARCQTTSTEQNVTIMALDDALEDNVVKLHRVVAESRAAQEQLAAMTSERDDANEQLKRLRNMEKNLARSNDRAEALQAEVDKFRGLSNLRVPITQTDEWPVVVHKTANHMLGLRMEIPDDSAEFRNVMTHMLRASIYTSYRTRLETFLSTADKQDGWYCLYTLLQDDWATLPDAVAAGKCKTCREAGDMHHCLQVRHVKADAGVKHLQVRGT